MWLDQGDGIFIPFVPVTLVVKLLYPLLECKNGVLATVNYDCHLQMLVHRVDLKRPILIVDIRQLLLLLLFVPLWRLVRPWHPRLALSWVAPIVVGYMRALEGDAYMLHYVMQLVGIVIGMTLME